MAEYDIPISKKKLWDWISQQPNLVELQPYNNENIYANFNHDDAQRKVFLQELMKKYFEVDIGNNVFEALLPKLSIFQKDDQLFSMTPRLAITNLPTTYTDLFPAVYQGFPIPIHTLEFKKMGFVLLWNKNGGTGVHDVRLVKCDNSGNLLPNAVTPDVLVEGTNIPTGRTTNGLINDFNIPAAFLNFRGFCKIQAKSTINTDDPILDALYVYLIRG